ncbi:MAG: adenylate/guanylate cyclase domain-containing protein [Chlamydiia bacterium]|nr:adenylate/guanylate cyclase domain-containing protein [Chlamydiia bacterium]
MKLRYRLFLWVAVVFSITFVASFYLEDRLTRVNLEHTYQDLLEKLDELNHEKTKAIEAYLGNMLYKIQAEIDAVLQGVAKYSLVRKGFEPTLDNLENENWLDSASLMITNKWIDFIQSTNEESLMSEIILDENDLSDTLHFPTNHSFHFVAIRDSINEKQWSEPYIGINFNMASLHSRLNNENDTDEGYFVYFNPQTLLKFQVDADLSKSLNLSINLLEPFLKWLELPAETFYLKAFLDKILEAQKVLKSNGSIIPNQDHWNRMIQEKLKTIKEKDSIDYEGFSFFEESDLSKKSAEERYYQEQVKYYVKEYIEHYNKVGLIWGLATLTKSTLFGKDPLSDRAPVGMGTVDMKSLYGKGLRNDTVFYSEPKYKIGKALQDLEEIPYDFLTTHLDVIAPEEIGHLFLGNTLRLDKGTGKETRTSYLTIGTHGGPILGSLARSTHQIALFLTENRIVKVSTPEGIEMDDKSWYDIAVEPLLSKPSGILTVSGKEYFFLHIVPYKKIDLHFFIFNPTEEEFAFINSVNEGAQEVIQKLSAQMRFAAIGGLLFVLLFLNNIAKRITKPITQLAGVTQTVAEGKLDDVEIPKETKKNRHDEIYTLYHSFFEMVKGLREKERVRSVLNKVVSKEIAEEALKGNIQLGGEEKRVTVFFGDIRNFTKMTEKMNPKEVIQFVNGCMTKVSKKIDKFGGVIDKYVGDEVMALFGAPIEKKENALNAIKSALEAIEDLQAWNVERKKEGLPEIKMGIGIHTGNVVAGNMGAENRLNYTVLGANVNLASRICSAAKGMEILISEETLHAEGVQETFECEKLQSVELKGFTESVNVYAVKGYTHRE